ncbi:MAG: YceI family protein [Woeseia sp.]
MQTSSITKILGILASLAAFGDAIAEGRYQIVAGESELRILVFRSGSLAGLGHNHVISTTALSGTVVAADSPDDRSIDIRIPVDSLVVDDPAVRAEEGQAFSAEMSEKDVRGTRENMLGRKLLEAEEFDEIRVFSDRLSGELPALTIEAGITLKGSQYVVELPASVQETDDRLIATGRTEIAHSELGLSPFTAGFGTLRVGERMTFSYRIVARKTDSHDE